MRTLAVLGVCGCAVTVFTGAANAGTDVFTSEAAFVGNLVPGFYFENFDGVPTGAAGPLLSFSNGTFSYDITAAGGGSNNLFNAPSLVSTDSALDALVITFTSGNVRAVGGIMFATDINFASIAADMTVTLSDGTVENYNTGGGAPFRGFISDVTITSLTIDASDIPVNAWSTLDELYVGTIPAPGTAALLGLGGLLAARRRR